MLQMKKYLVTSLMSCVLLLNTNVLAQTASDKNAQAATIATATQDYLHSNITKRTYRIQVMPVGDAPQEGYVPVYVLDGDMMFPTAATAAYTYFNHAKDNGAKPLLIVGIGYDNGKLLDIPQRSLDYAPPMAAHAKVSDIQPQKGEADLFLKMMQQELTPMLKQQYRLQDGKGAIMGHSYGGVFALYALLQHPDAFSHYIISSPSMWWNDGALQGLPKTYFKPLINSKAPKFVRLTVGEYEQAPSPYIDAQGERAKILAEKQMVNKVEAMGQQLQTIKQANVHLKQERYSGETHTGSMFRAILDGIKFIYTTTE